MRSKGNGVVNVSGILPFLQAAYTRRVDIAQIMDSNGAQISITGHFEGMLMALANVFGLYSSACYSGTPGTLFGGGSYGIAGHGAAGYNQSGEPAEFTALRFPTTSATYISAPGDATPWGNVDWAGQLDGNVSVGSTGLNTKCPVDLNGAIGFSAVIWRPSSGGITQIIPSLHGSPAGGAGQYVLNSKTVACPSRSVDGIDEVLATWARGSVIDFDNATNPANDASKYFGEGFRFRLRNYTGNSADKIDGTNTFGVVGTRIEDYEKFRGVAVTPLYQFGGKPTRAPALDFCGISGLGGCTDAALAARLKALVMAQRDSNGNRLSPMLLIQIIEGGNDANDSVIINGVPGLTQGKSLLSTTGEYRSATEDNNASNTAQGYANNTLTITRRIRYVWENVLNYPKSGLFFLIGCYHPQTQFVSTQQWSFVRQTLPTGAALVIASEPNCCFVNGYKLATYAEFGTYNGATGTSATNIREYNSTGSPWTAVATVPWFRNPGAEDAHLNQPGYLAWGQRNWNAVMDAAADAGLFTFRSRSDELLLL